MKTLAQLLLLASLSWASPISISTSITNSQYQTSLLGSASSEVYLQAFFGYPLGSITISQFQILQEPHEDTPLDPCWLLLAWIDYPEPPTPYTEPTDPSRPWDPSPPSGPPGPPILPPNPPELVQVPEPMSWAMVFWGGLLGAGVLAIFNWLTKRWR